VVLLPLMTVIILLVLTAVKYYAFFTLNKQVWITRRAERGGAEGQSAASVSLRTDGRVAGVADA
jgi:hypothetical protein